MQSSSDDDKPELTLFEGHVTNSMQTKPNLHMHASVTPPTMNRSMNRIMNQAECKFGHLMHQTLSHPVQNRQSRTTTSWLFETSDCVREGAGLQKRDRLRPNSQIRRSRPSGTSR
jgi:hypothetical protein